MVRLCACIALVLLTGISCSGRPEDRVGMIEGRRFDPDVLEVQAGGTVTWVNESGEAHTVTALQDGIPPDAEYFSSAGTAGQRAAEANLSDGLIARGEEFRWTFEVAGTYRYYCIPHKDDDMTGIVEVVPARE